MFLKRINKSIAIALIGITLSTPVISNVNALNKDLESISINSNGNFDIQDEIDNIIGTKDVNSMTKEEYTNLVKNIFESMGCTVEELEVEEINPHARKACTGKLKCDGKCTGRKCGIWRVQKISTYYSLSDCKQIVAKADAMGAAAEMSKVLTTLGKKPIPSFILGQYGKHVRNLKSFYQTAVKKGKGVSFEYEYCVHVTQSSSFSRNSKIVYK